MEEQVFKILITIFALLISVIGFFIASKLREIKEGQSENKDAINALNGKVDKQKTMIDEELKLHTKMIAENTRSSSYNSQRITSNSEKDIIINKMFDKSLGEVKSAMIAMGNKFDDNNKLLTQVLTQLKKGSL
jgi:uncharacterized protein YneF (UPF0154 family)